MKAIYLDCFSGISGNMLLGAFLQGGVPLSCLKEELQKLHLHEAYELRSSETSKQGIAAIYVEVVEENEHHAEGTQEGHSHEHHHHRSWQDIRSLIEASELSSQVKAKSCAIFETLAIAEGKVHHRPKEEVLFHEVGALDSIVDSVGAAFIKALASYEENLPAAFAAHSIACGAGTWDLPIPNVLRMYLGELG